ncbi:MAG TPA: zinc-finger domain-containing protein [Acidiferrobacteraceae bacterium]|nr:zinc-finger domain-containing protein [Acidiferrobacteraceae bacterium]
MVDPLPKPGDAQGDTLPIAQNRYDIIRKDLPLHCPMDSMSLWNSHPRVYLPIEDNGYAKCPYCGTEYALKGD